MIPYTPRTYEMLHRDFRQTWDHYERVRAEKAKLVEAINAISAAFVSAAHDDVGSVADAIHAAETLIASLPQEPEIQDPT